MEKDIVECYIAQLRREMRNIEYALGEIEDCINDQKVSTVYGGLSEAIAHNMKELCDARKYFNRAFRYLRDELDESDCDA